VAVGTQKSQVLRSVVEPVAVDVVNVKSQPAHGWIEEAVLAHIGAPDLDESAA
jgi:hypothetical protein